MAVSMVTYQLRGYIGSRSKLEVFDTVLRETNVLYNAALQEWRDAWRYQKESISRFDQQKELTLVRKDDPEGWGRLHVQVGRGVLVRLERARNSFFNRVKRGETPGFPRFKGWRRCRTIEIPEAGKEMLRVSGRRHYVRIKGLPTIEIRKTSRELPPAKDLKSIRITKHGRQLSVDLVFVVERDPLQTTETSIGIDAGVSDRLAFSDGSAIEPRVVDRQRIEHLQRRVSSTKKGSKTRRKRVAILANAHRRAHVQNRNECHRITSEIVRDFSLIAIENLKISNMTRSAKGTVEEPGRNVAAKSGLNRSILEQTWGMIRNQLTYKAEWAGRQLAVVNPAYTSQTCSRCGCVDATARMGKVYKCAQCGYSEDADVNAARNILHEAMAGVQTPVGGHDPPEIQPL